MITKKGFTTPEVLLTLGIIGVVAALCMPVLIPSMNSMQHKAKFKKSLNSLQNAVAANVMKENYDFAYTSSVGTGTSDMSIYNIFTQNLDVASIGKKGWSNTKSRDIFENSSNYTLFFSDGFVVTFPKTNSDGKGCTQEKPCKGVIDVNGPANPNRMATCDSMKGSGWAENEKCLVKKDADIYPVKFFDNMVVPNSLPARSVVRGDRH